MQDQARVAVKLTTPMLGRADAAIVTFSPRDGHWWMWRPCAACGGAEVPVLRSSSAAGQQCPECETRRRRIQPPGRDPAVWYDTWIRGWVVRLACGDPPAGALLPIEIPWFDADWADVYRAAADLAYGETDR
jgi:hypothetical protein